MPNVEFIADREIYCRVLCEMVPSSRKFCWIATATIKDLYVEKNRKMVPFLEILSGLVDQGVNVRLIHAAEPGPAFRRDFDRFPALFEGLERMLCPRVHFKSVVVDGVVAYLGSANLTGAGMGAKSERRRNFESGIITRDRSLLESIMTQFDRIWMGGHCDQCDRTDYCAEYGDMGAR